MHWINGKMPSHNGIAESNKLRSKFCFSIELIVLEKWILLYTIHLFTTVKSAERWFAAWGQAVGNQHWNLADEYVKYTAKAVNLLIHEKKKTETRKKHPTQLFQIHCRKKGWNLETTTLNRLTANWNANLHQMVLRFVEYFLYFYSF